MTATVMHPLDGHAIDLFDDNLLPPSLHTTCVSLSRQARFTGHTNRAWSIAHHSLLTGRICAAAHEWCAFEARCHDFDEAITGDISTPVKHYIGPSIAFLEARCQKAYARAIGFMYPFPQAVIVADAAALYVEWLRLRPSVPAPSRRVDVTSDMIAHGFDAFDELVVLPNDAAGRLLEMTVRQDQNRRLTGRTLPC